MASRTEYLELETRNGLVEDLTDPSRPDLTEEIAGEMVDRRFAAIRFGNADPNASARASQTRDFLTTDVDGNPVVEAGVRVLDNTSATTYRYYGDEVLEDGATDLRRAVGELCESVGNSFGPRTLVTLAGGQRLPISQIEPGQLVRTFDHELGSVAIGTVSQVIAHADVLYNVQLSDGTTLVVTEDHPFFNPATGTYEPLESFGPAEALFTDAAVAVSVDHIGAVNAGSVAWDLTVVDDHNFFVAATATSAAVLVHNAFNLCRELTGPSLRAWNALDATTRTNFTEALDGVIAATTNANKARREAIRDRFVAFVGEQAERSELAGIDAAWFSQAAAASALRGANRFDELLNNTLQVPALRKVSPDEIYRLLGNPTRTEFDRVLQLADRYNQLDPQVADLLVAARSTSGRPISDQLERLVPRGEALVDGGIVRLDGSTGNRPLRPSTLTTGGQTARSEVPISLAAKEEAALFPPEVVNSFPEGSVVRYDLYYDNDFFPDFQHPDSRVVVVAPDGSETLIASNLNDGTAPIAIAEFDLPPAQWFRGAPERSDFTNANTWLKAEVDAGRIQVTDDVRKFLERGVRFNTQPPGFVWHHHQQTRLMVLVRSDIHGVPLSINGHSGGNRIWGNAAGGRLAGP